MTAPPSRIGSTRTPSPRRPSARSTSRRTKSTPGWVTRRLISSSQSGPMSTNTTAAVVDGGGDALREIVADVDTVLVVKQGVGVEPMAEFAKQSAGMASCV